MPSSRPGLTLLGLALVVDLTGCRSTGPEPTGMLPEEHTRRPHVATVFGPADLSDGGRAAPAQRPPPPRPVGRPLPSPPPQVKGAVRSAEERHLRSGEELFAQFLALAPFGPFSLDRPALERSQQDFKRGNDERTRLLLAAQKAYQEVIRLGDPKLGVVAAARIGEMFHRYAWQLSALPCPRGLNPGQCGFYTEEILRVADPLRLKGQEAFRACDQKAARHGLDGRWPKLCRAYLETAGQ